MHSVENQDVEEDNINLRAVVERYLRNWRWFLLSLALCLIFAYLYLEIAKPVYKSSAELLVKDDKSNGSGPGDMSIFSDLGIFSNSSIVANEIELFKSHAITAKVIDQLDLQKQYFDINANFGYKAVEVYENRPINVVFHDPIKVKNFVLYVDILNESMMKVKYEIDDNSGDQTYTFAFDKIVKMPFGRISITKTQAFRTGRYKVAYRTRSQVMNNLQTLLSVSTLNKDATIFLVEYKGSTPDKNEAIINEFIKQYQFDKLNDKNIITEKTSQFIEERIDIISKELSNVDFRNLNFKRKNKLIDVQTDVTASLEKESTIEQQVISTRIQLDLATYVNKYLANFKEKYEVLPSNLGFEDASIAKLIEAYNDLVLRRTHLMANSTDENPLVLEVEKQITEVKKSLKNSLYNLQKSYELELDLLSAKEEKYQNKLLKMPIYEKEYKDIQREQQIKETLYLYLLQKREENEIAGAANVSNVKVIDHAYTAPQPTSPKKAIIFLAALVIGFVLPIGVIYTKDMLDTKVKNDQDIKSLGLSYVASIPKNTSDSKIVAKMNSMSPISEAFRLLRTNLTFMGHHTDAGNVIFVTSTISGEGKSFVSVNLAHSLAVLGSKTILVGLDLRLPKLAQYTGVQDGIGISNYLSDESCDLFSILHKSVINENMDVLLSGPIPPNPNELLNRPRLQQLFEELKKDYDYIIVDTAPIGLVADTIMVNHFADVTLFIVRAGILDKRMLRISRDLIDNHKIKNAGFVLNDINYHKAGYGYGYGYGYGNKS